MPWPIPNNALPQQQVDFDMSLDWMEGSPVSSSASYPTSWGSPGPAQPRSLLGPGGRGLTSIPQVAGSSLFADIARLSPLVREDPTLPQNVSLVLFSLHTRLTLDMLDLTTNYAPTAPRPIV